MPNYSDEKKRAVMNRLAKVSGHLQAVRRMIDDGRDFNDVLIQLGAVRSAITSTERLILKDYLRRCIDDALNENNEDAVRHLDDAIDKFVK